MSVFILKYQDEMLDLWKLQKFMEVVKPKILHTELKVWSDKYNEAGTIDTVFSIQEGVYKIDGVKEVVLPKGIYIGDLKTGASVDPKAFFQVAAYAKIYEEQYKMPVEGTLILHTKAKTKGGIAGFKVYVRYRYKKEIDQDYEHYRLIAALWERENVGIEPKTFDFPATIKLAP